MRRLLLLTTALTLVGLSAHAQGTTIDGPGTVRTLPPAPDVAGATAANALSEVVVVANRTPEPLEKVGQSVTVLTLPQIKADQETLVSDILARTPGVSFSRNGGPGGVTSVRIRGAESDQTVVLIDGVKLNDPSSPGGGYNFADLAVGDTARIEVLRGPQSTLYGSQAIGGVVNIVTAAPTRTLEGDAQVEGGPTTRATPRRPWAAGTGAGRGGERPRPTPPTASPPSTSASAARRPTATTTPPSRAGSATIWPITPRSTCAATMRNPATSSTVSCRRPSPSATTPSSPARSSSWAMRA